MNRLVLSPCEIRVGDKDNASANVRACGEATVHSVPVGEGRAVAVCDRHLTRLREGIVYSTHADGRTVRL